MKIAGIFLAALLAAASFQASAGRASVPVINYENIPITSASGGPLTAAQIKKAIVAGAATKQWTVQDQGPGRMLATLNVRGKHVVMTQINYTASQFSLVYSDSVNMRYAPGPDGSSLIHPRYNGWVLNLKEAISASLVTH